MHAREVILARAAVAEVPKNGLGAGTGRDEADVGGRRRERLLERCLVVVALRRDDDERSVVHVRGGQVERGEDAPRSRDDPRDRRRRRRRRSAIPARSPIAVSAIAAGERPIAINCGWGRTGSTCTSIAPSLWHAIGTVTTPSRSCPASSSGGPRNSNRGVPSSRAAPGLPDDRWLRAGATQPPAHPAVAGDQRRRARLPEDGERRQTTVASTNGSPRADIAAASARISGFTPSILARGTTLSPSPWLPGSPPRPSRT